MSISLVEMIEVDCKTLWIIRDFLMGIKVESTVYVQAGCGEKQGSVNWPRRENSKYIFLNNTLSKVLERHKNSLKLLELSAKEIRTIGI